MAGEFATLANVMSRVERASARLADIMERTRNARERVDVAVHLQGQLAGGTAGQRAGAVESILETGAINPRSANLIESQLRRYRQLTARSRQYAARVRRSTDRLREVNAEIAAGVPPARHRQLTARQTALHTAITTGNTRRARARAQSQRSLAAATRGAGESLAESRGAFAGGILGSTLGRAGTIATIAAAAIDVSKYIINHGLSTIQQYGPFSGAGAAALAGGQLREVRRSILTSNQLGDSMIGFMNTWQDLLDKIQPVTVQVNKKLLNVGEGITGFFGGVFDVAKGFFTADKELTQLAIREQGLALDKATGGRLLTDERRKELQKEIDDIKKKRIDEGKDDQAMSVFEKQRANFRNKLFSAQGLGKDDLETIMNKFNQGKGFEFAHPFELWAKHPEAFGQVPLNQRPGVLGRMGNAGGMMPGLPLFGPMGNMGGGGRVMGGGNAANARNRRMNRVMQQKLTPEELRAKQGRNFGLNLAMPGGIDPQGRDAIGAIDQQILEHARNAAAWRSNANMTKIFPDAANRPSQFPDSPAGETQLQALERKAKQEDENVKQRLQDRDREINRQNERMMGNAMGQAARIVRNDYMGIENNMRTNVFDVV